MNKKYLKILVLFFAAIMVSNHFNCYAAKIKLAQSGFGFLSVTSDAKASAMGEAVTSFDYGSAALFFNPAGMANMHDKVFDLALSLNSWIANIRHSTISLAVNPYGGKYGVVGLAIQYVDYGDDIQGTMVWVNDQGYIDTEMLDASALSCGLGYAKMLSDKFSVGGQVKFVYQNLARSMLPTIENDNFFTKRNVANGASFDFGTLFKTGYKSLAFGMSVRNFSKELKYEEEGFQLPLLFTLGISMDLMDFEFMDFTDNKQTSLVMSIDATHPRAHREQIKIGLDYRIMNVLSLRGGYISGNDEDAFSFGMGISYSSLALDYAYTPFGVFDNVQRITARLSF